MTALVRSALGTLLIACPFAFSAGEPSAAPSAGWMGSEAGALTGHVQLTFPEKFLRAGEAYFSRNDKWIVFQAIPRPAEGKSPDEHYSMYVAKVIYNDDGDITGLEEPLLMSPPGSANTCGYFNPKKPWEIIFGSTVSAPQAQDTPGYQRGTRSYRWAFPAEMDVVAKIVPPMLPNLRGPNGREVNMPADQLELRRIISQPGYQAECSFDPSGRYIVYANVQGTDEASGRPQIGLDLLDTKVNRVLTLVKPQGYNGGPFFSPDGSMICMRADRKGDDLLQVYVLELDQAQDGSIVGVKSERQVTDNGHVNWAPFWHASSNSLVYATSEVGHDNYEVFSVEVPRGESAGKKPSELKHKRITHAAGFDGLPVFSEGAVWMMWTSQRGPKLPSESKPSSQLWAARTVEIEP